MVGRRVAAALALGLLTLASAPLAASDHRQDGAFGTIAFDHRAGNEWWVEVKVTADSDYISGVYARSESGTWQPLTLREWGNWAASFRVPPGERVQFQAYRAGGMSDAWRSTSCFFTHPAGVEQCDPGSTDPFAATFRGASGNAWWFQVFIDSNRPLASATLVVDDVMGERWIPLKKQSWGGWAVSTHLPQGTVVRAVAFDGTKAVESYPCWLWTSAAPTDRCPPDYGPQRPGAWATRFDHVAGNAWWVEAKAGPVGPARMWARDDGGPWVELSKRSWGAWAASFHVEPGHKVQFKAEVEGQVLHSCWFTHPQGLGPDGHQICRNLENSP